MAKQRKSGFANARVEKLVRTAGAVRVSADAVYRLNEFLTEYAMNIAKRLTGTHYENQNHNLQRKGGTKKCEE